MSGLLQLKEAEIFRTHCKYPPHESEGYCKYKPKVSTLNTLAQIDGGGGTSSDGTLGYGTIQPRPLNLDQNPAIALLDVLVQNHLELLDDPVAF